MVTAPGMKSKHLCLRTGRILVEEEEGKIEYFTLMKWVKFLELDEMSEDGEKDNVEFLLDIS